MRKVTAEQLIDFVVNHGEEFSVTMKDVGIVGLDRCLDGASACNAACKNDATEYDIFDCYFSRNFKCHLNQAIALSNAEYIIDVVEYFGTYDSEVAGGGTIYCNSFEEMQKETNELQHEYCIGYIVRDKNDNVVSRFNYHPY